MTDEKTRRRVLQAGGVAIAGLLAGCGEDSSDGDLDGLFSDGTQTTDRAEPFRPKQTETPIELETETPPETATTIETVEPIDDCGHDYPLEPTSSEGAFTLFHDRQESGTRLLEGTRLLFNQGDDHPTMSLERAGDSYFLNQLRTSIPAGEGPHLFQWNHDIAGEFVRSEFLSDQEGNLRVGECAFADVAWDACRYEGHTIGVPIAAECPALLYNKAILEEMGVEPPESFADWISIMEEYHDPYNGEYGLAHPVSAYFVSWAAQTFGEAIYDGDADELGITSDALIRGLNLILEDLKPYMPEDPSEQVQRSIFEGGNSPFLVNGPWAIAGLEAAGLDVGVTPIPTPDGGVARPYSGVQLLYFARKMNDYTAGTQAARGFAEWYCTNVERLRGLATNTSMIPVKTGLGREQLPETTRGFAAQFETSYPMPQNPKMSAVWVPFEQGVLDAFNSGNDPAPLMANAAEEIRNSWV